MQRGVVVTPELLEIEQMTATLIEPLFPVGEEAFPASAWGDADCPPPPVDTFAPHGIDIERLRDGAQALYVVNHGGRAL